jgi:hypothetical protein
LQYIKEDIEKILIEHKEKEGQLLEINLKIEEYQERLDYAGTVHCDTDEEVIQSMQLGGQAYDSIHNNTNKISDTTANTAMKYNDEKMYINEEDRVHLQFEIIRLNEQKEELNKKIVRVKNWLDKIEEKQKCIIEEYYINNKGKNWERAVNEYNKQQKELTERQLRVIRNKGIESILKIVNI